MSGEVAFLEELKKTHDGKYAQAWLDKSIEVLKQADFAEFIMHWLADVYDSPCQYDYAGIDTSDYISDRDPDFCEECNEHTAYECWKKFLIMKYQEAREKK